MNWTMRAAAWVMAGVVAAGPTLALAQTAAPTSTSVEARQSLAEPSLSADGSMIAFVSGGDVWEVEATGGVARLLVTDAATEGRPLYSPDGQFLAFTSTRGGQANIYVLNRTSGVVTRITYAEANEELDAWSPDGKWLYFASAINDVGRQPDIFRVAATGGTPLEVSREQYLSEFQAAPSPDGQSIALMARGFSNGQWWRNGSSHIDQSEIWVKGVAQDGAYRRLLDDDARHAWPMWTPDGQTLYFMSDKSGTENLWRIPTAGGAAQAVTDFKTGRVLYPSIAADGSAIVFEREFGIWRLDPATGQAAAVPITLRGGPAAEGSRILPLTSFDRMALSPDGQKVAVIARGELFAASLKDGGPAQRITTSIGAEREVVWSPDSRKLLYVSERGLDRVVATYDVAALTETVLTGPGIASALAWSPDGKSAVYVLNNRELRLLTLPTPGKPTTDRLLFTGALATDERGPRPVWSPDGLNIAFPVVDRRSFTNLHVVAAAGGEARPITFLANGQLGGVAWSPDGKFILFDTSQRTEDSRIVRVDLLPHVPKYREDQFRGLFDPAKPEETTPPAEGATPATPPGPSTQPARPSVAIVYEGIRERATILPLGLNADTPVISDDGKTLVFRASERGQQNLYSYSMDELAAEPPVAQQLTTTTRPKADFALTKDGKTLVYLEGGTVISSPLENPRPKATAIAASMEVDFSREKMAVFDQAWTILNQVFFDPDFNGQDWPALRTRYQPYVAGARTSDEMRRVISLMIGELNASHSGIGRPAGGPGSDRIGDIGLRYDREAFEAGRGLVVREVITLGPAFIEGTVKVGERLVSVNGSTITASTNLDALLQNQVGRRTVLGIEGTAGRRDAVVRPVSASAAAGLVYRQWVNNRRAYVERVSGGRLGYVHIPDMSEGSLNQLYLDLDAQNQSKQGVVIDIRNNNGGFVNGYALDVFSRRNFLTMTPRDLFSMPGRQALGQRALDLPTVLVTNESSLSDAEDFTEGYRALGLGKVVGQPTAGWIIFTGGERLIDGSTLRTPSTRIQGIAGDDMEMNSRPVDIVVERPLGETGAGVDAQLDAAVAVLLNGPPAAPTSTQ
ncbi:S41 family peptidase [Brevundimonas sp.]|uniref:S41 family peptidase n=1 Tax=Brevundimonas sp. TaxID=1871086 RepID=UPI0037844AEB